MVPGMCSWTWHAHEVLYAQIVVSVISVVAHVLLITALFPLDSDIAAADDLKLHAYTILQSIVLYQCKRPTG